MTGKLYVGNLPLSASESELQSKFNRFGQVLSVIISVDAATGRRSRTGYVEMATSGEALAAIHGLNMTSYDDVVISVCKVRLKQSA